LQVFVEVYELVLYNEMVEDGMNMENELLKNLNQKPVIFEREFDLQTIRTGSNLPFTVEQNEDGEYVVEGPRIEKML